jgi:hypothetical protein
MKIYSNGEVFGLALIFGTAGVFPPSFLRYGLQMLKLNETCVKIEPELALCTLLQLSKS